MTCFDTLRLTTTFRCSFCTIALSDPFLTKAVAKQDNIIMFIVEKYNKLSLNLMNT